MTCGSGLAGDCASGLGGAGGCCVTAGGGGRRFRPKKRQDGDAVNNITSARNRNGERNVDLSCLPGLHRSIQRSPGGRREVERKGRTVTHFTCEVDFSIVQLDDAEGRREPDA